jgi:uncharacterized protein (DUF2147 family)
MQTMRQFFGPAALVAALVVGTPAFAAASADPTGVWINDTGRGAVEIKPCGAGLCGHVVWVKDQSDSGGCGRQIIGDAAPVGAGTWDNGWIYSPERKKKYDVELTMNGDKLKVKGYAGTKLFSKTMIWTRAPADLVRCGTTEASAKPAQSTAAAAPAVKPDVKTATAEPAPAPAPAPSVNDKTAAAPVPAPEEEQGTEDGPDMAQLSDALGDFLKKGADGKCNLDLPWVKVKFDCEKK